MGSDHLKIQLAFCKRGQNPETIIISPDEYFDPLEKGELLEIDSTPKHLEQYRYITNFFQELSWTRLQIHDQLTSKKLISEEKYWGEDNIYRANIVSSYKGSKRIFWEQTIEIYNSANQILHVIKTGEPKPDRIGGIISHTILTEKEDVIIVDMD
jgi:hypothetical protein